MYFSKIRYQASVIEQQLWMIVDLATLRKELVLL